MSAQFSVAHSSEFDVFVKEPGAQCLGAFFWDYSGIGILRIDLICVPLGVIPFSE